MTDQLGHKITEAFVKKDAELKFEGKDALWERLSAGKRKLVIIPIFWRAAAIFLGILLSGSLIAAFSIRKDYRHKLAFEKECNQELQLKIDSLLKLEPKVIVKTEVKEIVHTVDNSPSQNQKIEQLQEQNKLLSREKLFLENRMKERLVHQSTQIDSLNNLLSQYNLEVKPEESFESTEGNKPVAKTQFEVKHSENNEVINKTQIDNEPRLQLMLFKNSMNNKQYDSGSTLFKK